jgi:hypothetical protein
MGENSDKGEAAANMAREARFANGDHFEVAAEHGRGAAVRVTARMSAMLAVFHGSYDSAVFSASNLLAFNRMLRGVDALERAMKEALSEALEKNAFDPADLGFVIHAATAVLDMDTVKAILDAGCSPEVLTLAYPRAMSAGPEWASMIGNDAWLRGVGEGVEVMPEAASASRSELEMILRAKAVSPGVRFN